MGRRKLEGYRLRLRKTAWMDPKYIVTGWLYPWAFTLLLSAGKSHVSGISGPLWVLINQRKAQRLI